MKKDLIFLLPVIFVSCASFRVPVPGETAVRKNNIFVEYMNIADSYNDLGKYDKAITYYKMAKSNRKLKWTANYKLARAYAMNKNWEEAQKLYLELYRRDPENISIQMSIAYIYAMNGKLPSAETIYSSLVKNNPENADVLVNYINVLFAMERYEEAEANLSVLKEKFQDNTNISSFEKKLEEIKSGDTEETQDGENEAAEKAEDSDSSPDKNQ